MSAEQAGQKLYDSYELAQLSSLYFKLYNHLYYGEYSEEQINNNVNNIKTTILDNYPYNVNKEENLRSLKEKIYSHKKLLLDKMIKGFKFFREESEKKELKEPIPYVYASYPSNERVYKRADGFTSFKPFGAAQGVQRSAAQGVQRSAARRQALLAPPSNRGSPAPPAPPRRVQNGRSVQQNPLYSRPPALAPPTVGVF